jgi:hypothetical protein
MNKKLVFLSFIALAVSTAQPMLQQYKHSKTQHNRPKFVHLPEIKPSNALKADKPLSVNLKDEAQKTMASIGTQPFYQAHKTALNMSPNGTYAYLPNDQQLFFNFLALPIEASHKIVVDLCEKDQQMLNVFCSHPLDNALVWRALMTERYKNEKNGLARVISFPQLYCLPPATIIALADATHHFKHNPTRSFSINDQQEQALCCLPSAVKNNGYFANKKFLQTDDHRRIILSEALRGTIILGPPLVIAQAYISHLTTNESFFEWLTFFGIITPAITFPEIALILTANYYVCKHRDNFAQKYYKTINHLGK